jgi:hypothetical protein
MAKKTNTNIDRILERTDEIQGRFDINSLIAQPTDFPGMGQQIVFDHVAEKEEIKKNSINTINNIARLYLGDSHIYDLPHIIDKRHDDAMQHAHAQYLVRQSERSVTTIMQQIENGDNKSNMWEVLSMIQKEMRDNIKLLSFLETNIRKSYREIKDDMGIADIPMLPDNIDVADTSDNKILDMKQLNDMMERIVNASKKHE